MAPPLQLRPQPPACVRGSRLGPRPRPQRASGLRWVDVAAAAAWVL